MRLSSFGLEGSPVPAERQFAEDIRTPLKQPSASGRVDDLALVQRLVDNSEAAWCKLVNQFAGQVRARIIRVTISCGSLNRSAMVDDILAEVFRALLANEHAALRAYQGRCSLSTYLCAIATRVALRYSIKPAHGIQSEDVLTALEDTKAAAPEHRALDSEQNQWLLQHIDKLPGKQRQLIRLFHLEGKSYKEISVQLSMPIGSIGPSIGRAEAQLRQMLGEDFLN
jgi:RNA polymerase sigma-70 factor, ECF subfamily